MLLSLHSDLIVPSQSIKEDTPFEAEFARRYCGMITPPEAEWLRRSCGICSMRKTSEEFNSEIMIKNVWTLCKEEAVVDELPYWETINRYLEKLEAENLQDVINCLCRRLLRSRVFEDMRIRGKYWQVIIDGTQLCSSCGSDKIKMAGK